MVNRPITPASTDDKGIQKRPRPNPPKSLVVQRSPGELEKLLSEKRMDEIIDDEVIMLSLKGKIPGYALERSLKDYTRAIKNYN
ncbi:hypothetical protein GGS23DRAFT_593864 [Durotheca rogersii]|uniref:uncharacterized protein n=1 Tax=Durotheca rogersii TaxID=419775 RepID=UPI00221F7FBF|nr:uncharacterized protein GGS23DRAFT_593864 [Durotheca rogersii]KAI5865684.1 hypothetical protein GGS23DRAFT_593864 [Durotheca rogersii]